MGVWTNVRAGLITLDCGRRSKRAAKASGMFAQSRKDSQPSGEGYARNLIVIHEGTVDINRC